MLFAPGALQRHRSKTLFGIEPVVVTAGVALVSGFLAWRAGTDINWDWQNYHDYGARSLFQNRGQQDAAPAGLQSFLSPYVYVPSYLLRETLPGGLATFLIGALQGLPYALVWMLTRALLPPMPTSQAISFALAATIMALTAPMALSELGGSMSDSLTAIPILAALLLCTSPGVDNGKRLIIAGLLVGASAGLKLTNLIYAIGFAAALLTTQTPGRSVIHGGAGGFVGLLLTGGPWSLHLWQSYGSPTYPFYNAIFRSPEAALINFADNRFLPSSLFDAVMRPFRWAAGGHSTSELPFRDLRFAAMYVVGGAALASWMLTGRTIQDRRIIFMVVFFCVSYIAWAMMFSIQRYAVPLELLAPAIIITVTAAIMNQTSAAIASGTMALAMLVTMQTPSWGHIPHDQPPNVPTTAKDVPAIYLLAGKPLGFLAGQLHKDARLFQLADPFVVVPGGIFDRRIRDGVESPPVGGVWSVSNAGLEPADRLITPLGYERDEERACWSIVVGARINVCPLKRK